MADIIKIFLKSEEGATAGEYAIMASAIAAVIVLIVIAIGAKTSSLFNEVQVPWE